MRMRSPSPFTFLNLPMAALARVRLFPEHLAKRKRLLRDVAEQSVEALWQTIGRLLGRTTPSECTNHIRQCGFAESCR